MTKEASSIPLILNLDNGPTQGPKVRAKSTPTRTRLTPYHRRRKLTDKDLPNSIRNHEDFTIDSQMYQDLVDMERKLDWTMMRKKVEIEDAMAKVPPVRVGILGPPGLG